MIKLILKEWKRRVFSFTSIIYCIVPVLFLITVMGNGDHAFNIQKTLNATALFFLNTTLLGFFSVYQDESNNMKDLVSVSGKQYVVTLAKVISILLTQILFILPLLMIILVQFFAIGTPLTFLLKDSLRYLLLYYIIGGFIGAVIGMIIGTLITYTAGFVVAFFTGIVLGPLGVIFLGAIPFVGDSEFLMKLLFRVNISQFSWQFYTEIVSGFPVESQLFYYRLSFLFLCLALLFLFKSRRDVRESRKFSLILVLCFLLFFGGFTWVSTTPRLVRYMGNATPYSDYPVDIRYYDGKVSPDTPGQFRLTSMVGEIDLRRAFSFEGTLDVVLTEDTDVLDVSLYHNLHLRKVMLGDKRLKVVEEGDLRKIYLPSLMKKGAQLSLEVEYSGFSSPTFFAGEKGTILPSFFCWIPYPGHYHSFRDDGMKPVTPLYTDTPVEYDFKIRSKVPLYCSLDLENDRYKGVSQFGVFIVAGNIVVEQVGDFTYYMDPLLYHEGQNNRETREWEEAILRAQKDLNEALDYLEIPKVPVVKKSIYFRLSFYQSGWVYTNGIHTRIPIGFSPIEEQNYSKPYEAILGGNLSFILQDKRICDFIIYDILSERTYESEEDYQRILARFDSVEDGQKYQQIKATLRDKTFEEVKPLVKKCYEAMQVKKLTADDLLQLVKEVFHE